MSQFPGRLEQKLNSISTQTVENKTKKTLQKAQCNSQSNIKCDDCT